MIRRLLIITAALAVVGLAVLATTRESPAPALPEALRADHILVEKSAHRLTLLAGDRVLKRYAVALGHGGLAPKTREGDDRTPEGSYRIDGRNPLSHYHLALHISYPEPRDVQAAAFRGEPPGGDIMIHGLPNGFGGIGSRHRVVDWTAGCIAVTDAEIEEIWHAVPDGTPVEIRP